MALLRSEPTIQRNEIDWEHCKSRPRAWFFISLIILHVGMKSWVRQNYRLCGRLEGHVCQDTNCHQILSLTPSCLIVLLEIVIIPVWQIVLFHFTSENIFKDREKKSWDVIVLGCQNLPGFGGFGNFYSHWTWDLFNCLVKVSERTGESGGL